MSSYYIRLSLLTALVCLSMLLYNVFTKEAIPVYGFWGVLFLAGLSGFIHYFVYGNKTANPQKTIRRMMMGSMMRMMASILFLAISLFAYRPISIPFVISYTVCFFLLMVFEIFQIRRKLRPDFNGGSH